MHDNTFIVSDGRTRNVHARPETAIQEFVKLWKQVACYPRITFTNEEVTLFNPPDLHEFLYSRTRYLNNPNNLMAIAITELMSVLPQENSVNKVINVVNHIPEDAKIDVQALTRRIQLVSHGMDEDKIVEQIIEAEAQDTGSRDYYKDVIPGYEYFQLMEHLLGHEGFVGHCRGQVFKYMLRFGKKDDVLLEVTKVAWYSAYLKEYLGRHAKGQTPYKPK